MLDLTNHDEQPRAVIIRPPTARGLSIKAIINAWLDEEAKSAKSRHKYEEIIFKFRAFLQSANLDLLFDSTEEIDFCATIADAAQMFSKLRAQGSTHKGEVARTTIAQRLYILSSFYRYCMRRKHLRDTNPIDLVSKEQPEAYAHAEAIAPEEVMRRLAAIDRSNEQGMQAYILLAIAVYTGRRVEEIRTLCKKSILLENGCIKLDFPHTKRDKHMQDVLTPDLSADLADWLNRFYEKRFMQMSDSTPLWVNVYHKKKRGQPLGYHALSDMCFKYLGTRKFHVTRHSFTEGMRATGADAKHIQDRLGHSSLETTGRYLKALGRAENPYANKLAELFGLNRRDKQS